MQRRYTTRRKRQARSRSPIAVAIAVLVVAVAAVFAVKHFLSRGPAEVGRWECQGDRWVAVGEPDGPVPADGCPAGALPSGMIPPEDVPTSALPFNEARLRRDLKDLKPDTWFLHFDLPNGYTLLEVAFAEDAVCRFNGEEVDCAGVTLIPSNAKSAFAGRRIEPGKFLVSELNFDQP
jgi:hypothetical protein